MEFEEEMAANMKWCLLIYMSNTMYQAGEVIKDDDDNDWNIGVIV